MGVVDALGGQDVLLGGAGGGEGLGAQVAGELDGGHADAAGGGVDEEFLAGLQVAQVGEGVVGGEEDDGGGGGLGEGPAGRDGGQQPVVGDGQRAHGGRGSGP